MRKNTKNSLQFGMTRYLLLLVADLNAPIKSLVEFSELLSEDEATARAPGWIQAALAGTGAVPHENFRLALLDYVVELLKELEVVTPKLHFAIVYSAIENFRGEHANKLDDPVYRATLLEWKNELCAWQGGLADVGMPRSAREIESLLVSLYASELMIEIASMSGTGARPYASQVRNKLLLDSEEWLLKALGNLEALRKLLPTGSMFTGEATALRIRGNILISMGLTKSYDERFTDEEGLAKCWNDYDLVKKLHESKNIALTSLLTRNLIELAMYARLDGPDGIVSSELADEWTKLGELLEQDGDLKNRDHEPGSWGCSSIAKDKDLAPYMRWYSGNNGS